MPVRTVMPLIAMLLATGCILRARGGPGDDDADAALADGAAGDAAAPVAPVVWYRMDEDPGAGVAADSSGSALDGTCAPPACPASAPGMIGQAFDFDGVEDRFVVADDGQLDLADGFTVAVWLLPQATMMATALAKPQAAGPGASWELAVFPADLGFCTDDALDQTGEHCLIQSASLAIGNWAHVALTWDGATKRLYLDGAEIASEPAVTVFDASDLVFGGDVEDGAFGSAFRGSIDELQIYDRALTAAEIATVF